MNCKSKDKLVSLLNEVFVSNGLLPTETPRIDFRDYLIKLHRFCSYADYHIYYHGILSMVDREEVNEAARFINFYLKMFPMPYLEITRISGVDQATLKRFLKTRHVGRTTMWNKIKILREILKQRYDSKLKTIKEHENGQKETSRASYVVDRGERGKDGVY